MQPDRPDERERVEAAGGRVINWHGSRVLGVLATSRSIGKCLGSISILFHTLDLFIRSSISCLAIFLIHLSDYS